jgi:hypothetical protein
MYGGVRQRSTAHRGRHVASITYITTQHKQRKPNQHTVKRPDRFGSAAAVRDGPGGSIPARIHFPLSTLWHHCWKFQLP